MGAGRPVETGRSSVQERDSDDWGLGLWQEDRAVGRCVAHLGQLSSYTWRASGYAELTPPWAK